MFVSVVRGLWDNVSEDLYLYVLELKENEHHQVGVAQHRVSQHSRRARSSMDCCPESVRATDDAFVTLPPALDQKAISDRKEASLRVQCFLVAIWQDLWAKNFAVVACGIRFPCKSIAREVPRTPQSPHAPHCAPDHTPGVLGDPSFVLVARRPLRARNDSLAE